MAVEIPGLLFTLPSAADYRTGNGQWRFVKPVTGGNAQQSVAGELAIGVRQNTPNLAEAMTIMNSGITFLEVGTGGLTVGALVASDAAGRGVVATTGQYINAICLEAGATSGLIVTVLLLNNAAKA